MTKAVRILQHNNGIHGRLDLTSADVVRVVLGIDEGMGFQPKRADLSTCKCVFRNNDVITR
jgi:hypothetical protein